MLILGQKACFKDPPSLKFHDRTDIINPPLSWISAVYQTNTISVIPPIFVKSCSNSSSVYLSSSIVPKVIICWWAIFLKDNSKFGLAWFRQERRRERNNHSAVSFSAVGPILPGLWLKQKKANLWLSLPGTFCILIGKFSYFIIRFYYRAMK